MQYKSSFLAAAAIAANLVEGQVGDAVAACNEIQSQMSSGGSVMTSYLSPSFLDATSHWFFVSSSQTPACVVEVASVQDVSMVMQTISKYRAPWAVKSGGHASNPGFSSTTGVHLSIANLNQVTLSPDKSSVEIGFGLRFNEVFNQLDGSGVNIVGGRTAGPGVGGFTLGGGYSWKTNQFGLTSDTVTLYNVVLPNGTITTAAADTNPDLFWALKGGLNKFGVVTSAVFKTHPQPDQVYAGISAYSGDEALSQVLAATQNFTDTNTDPRAQLLTTLNGTPLGTVALVIPFYDGPDGRDKFAMFDGIDSTLSLVYNQKFSTFVTTVNSNLQTSPRGSFSNLPTTSYTPAFLDACLNQTRALANIAANHSGIIVSYDIEPFLDYGQHAVDSAFPHADSAFPLNLYYSWVEADDDDFWLSTIAASVEELKQVAIQEGIYDPNIALYPNYSPRSATAEQMYGVDGAARLQAIRRAYDPELVGDLTGGYVI